MAVENKKLMTGALRPDIELIRGDSLLLFDRQRELYFKVDSETLKIVSLLTGSMPLERFMELLRRNGISADLQKVTEILQFLHQKGLLIPQPGEMSKKKQMQDEFLEKNRLLRFSASYLFFRLPPWRPEHFFEKIAPYVSWTASKPMVILYAVIALTGYLFLIRELQNAVAEFRNSLSWIGLVKYFAAILFVKCIHEAAHSLAAIHFRCRVRGIGVGFMVFCPRLYTDTTDSWRLPRHQRILIDSAGIIAELLLGGAAAIFWNILPPGPLHSTMFYILTVSTLSTLAINGNPFIRYDGYYILCDLTGADNLMSRSAETVKQYWRRYLLHIGKVPDFAGTWKYALFGTASFIYRIFLYTSIILVIYHKFNKVIALVMIFLEIYSIGLYPLWREVQQVCLLSKRTSRKAFFLFSGGAVILLLFLMNIPVSWNEEIPGEVSSRRKIIVAAHEDGFLVQELKPCNVKQGDILCQMVSPRLDFSLDRMQNKYQEEELSRIFKERDSDRFAEAKLTMARQRSIRSMLDELKRQKKALTIHAPVNGSFIPVSRDFHRERFVRKNTILGHVNSPEKIIVAYADDRQLGSLAAGQEAEFFIRGTLKKYTGVIRSVSTVPASMEGSPLLQPFGGTIPVYAAQAPDEKKYKTSLTQYRIEVDAGNADSLVYGQTLKVCIKKRESTGHAMLRMILAVWRKEFTEIF